MYKYPPVGKFDNGKVVKKESKKKESSYNNILEDYLGRNQSVVKKNVSKDKLSKNQLEELLKLEEFDKRRPLVMNAIKQKLEVV